MRWQTASLGILLLIAVSGCGGRLQSPVLVSNSGDLKRQVELRQVPFFSQTKHLCGPAALAAVLNHAGARLAPSALAPKVFLPGRGGSLQVEMLTGVRRLGLVPYVIKPTMRALYREVAAGNPVVVLQNLGLSWYPRWHYAVVIGYDLDRRKTILRSGTIRRYVVAMKTFERTWRRSGHWALVVLPPGRLPQTAEELPYLQAVAGLEQVRHWRQAISAYQAALARWPQSLHARLGIGNSYYAMGDLPRATVAYRRAIRQHPKAAIAYNNLAQVLLEQNRLAAAERAARQAVRIGGRFLADYRQTLASIRARRRR